MPPADRLGPRDILGVPALPPGRTTGLVNRLRDRVAAMHRAMAPPPVQILEGVFGVLDHAALVALCDLGVPESLDGRYESAALARKVGADETALDRLLRYSAARGWVKADRRGRFAPNRVTRFLHVDHPGGWRAWVSFVGGAEVVRAVGNLAEALREGSDPFAAANGAGFFEYVKEHPERAAAFDGAMAAGARMHGLALARSLDWSAEERVCDVGGGNGSLLRTLLATNSGLRGVLLDLPEVVANVDPGDRLEVVGGDAFAAVPSGCDTYLFVNVLHDWSDDDAVDLLGVTARCAPPRSRVVVVEAEPDAKPVDGVAIRSDLLMLALTPGGRERTVDEFSVLANRAGLAFEGSTLLASADRATVFRTPA